LTTAVSPTALDYNVLKPGNDLIFTLHYLEDQSGLRCLLVGQFANSPNHPFPCLFFALMVGFVKGVGFIGLSFIAGGTVA